MSNNTPSDSNPHIDNLNPEGGNSGTTVQETTLGGATKTQSRASGEKPFTLDITFLKANSENFRQKALKQARTTLARLLGKKPQPDQQKSAGYADVKDIAAK